MTRALSMEDGEEKARQFLKIATAFYGMERDTAEMFYQRANDLLTSLDAPDLQADAKVLGAEIYRQDWSRDTLMDLLEEAMQYYHQIDDQSEVLEIFITQGALHSNRGLYEDAIPFSLNALDLAKELKDTLQQGKIAYNLGVIYYNTSLQEKAVEKFKESQNYFKSVGKEDMAGLALSGVVNVYLNTDKNDTALVHALALLALGDSLNYSRLQLNARSNLGAIYNNLGAYKLAVKYYRESEPFARRFGSKLSLINCWCALGKSHAHLNQLDSAAYFFSQAYELNAGENMTVMHQFCSKEYAEVLSRLGRYQSSSELLLRYVVHQDSVLIKENKEVIASLEAKYQASQKDAEIAGQEYTIARRTSQRNLFLLGLLFSVGSAGFAIYRFHQNKKLKSEKIANLEKYQKILAMDSMLQGQEEERKRIAQDLHDGLGTLLAAARIQMQNIQREIDKLGDLQLFGKTEKLIDNACKEVRRISHDMMPTALVDLGFVAAVEDLVDEIRLQLDLVFHLDLPDGKIEMDNGVALHLYRIVQEILQNIVKHAQANIVELTFKLSEDKYDLKISDDGVGFDPDQNKLGLGHKTIKSRVAYLEGNLTVASGIDEGCHYHITAPRAKVTVEP